MAGVTGRQADIAFAKFAANSWGVAASVTKGVYFQSDGGIQLRPAIIADDAFGQAFLEITEVGNIEAPTPPFSAVSRYDDHGYIFEACAMGSPATVTLSNSADGEVTSWQHVFDLAPTNDGLGVTVAIDRSRYVEELTSAKIHGWQETQGEGGLMRTTFKVVGSKSTNISSVNINSTVGGASYPSLGNRVMMKHGVLRMNLHGGNSLVAADAVKAESVAFDWDRPQDAPHVYGQDYIHEPADNGFPTFRLEVTYPRMIQTSAESLYAGLRDASAWKADWTFTGAYINSTDRYTRMYEFPYVQLETFETPLAGANQVKPHAVFQARQAPTSPLGMAFIRPFRLTRIQVNSIHAFA
jgi:hypothetical protein